MLYFAKWPDQVMLLRGGGLMLQEGGGKFVLVTLASRTHRTGGKGEPGPLDNWGIQQTFVDLTFNTASNDFLTMLLHFTDI